jgi:tetratricopeptide (TPR) repeat protein
MIWNTARALCTAIAIGFSAFVAASLVPGDEAQAGAAPSFKIENKALADAVTASQNAAKAGNYAEALAKAKEADAIQGKPPQLTILLHQQIVSYAQQSKNYPEALAMIDRMLAAKEGDRNQLLSQGWSISTQAGNTAKRDAYTQQLGSNLTPEARLAMASEMAKSKQYKQAIEYVQPLLETGKQPSELVLRFLQANYFALNDLNGRRNALEQLVLYYGKPEYWKDLLQLARNEKGLTDEQQMDISRLRLAVGDLKTQDDYQEAAQIALVAMYPGEAKIFIDKANAAKVLSGERAGRLMKMTGDQVAADAAALPALQSKAATDPAAGVKLSRVLASYGKFPEAEAAVRAAGKGKLADPEAAKVQLGHALLGQGKRPEATAAYNSVARASKWYSVSRLWSLFSRRGTTGA